MLFEDIDIKNKDFKSFKYYLQRIKDLTKINRKNTFLLFLLDQLQKALVK